LSEHEKCSVSGMIGEFIREVAVLVLVFVPLEAYKGLHWRWWQTTGAVLATVIAAIGVPGVGIQIERQRP
jgi:hypothetical protein